MRPITELEDTTALQTEVSLLQRSLHFATNITSLSGGAGSSALQSGGANSSVAAAVSVVGSASAKSHTSLWPDMDTLWLQASDMDIAALGAPATICVIFLISDTLLACRARRDTAAARDSASEVSATPPRNWSVIIWANVAVGLTYLNITCIITIAAQQFSKEVDSLALAGLWVGLYGIGGLLALAFFWQVPPERAHRGLTIYSVFMFCGNAIILLGSLVGLVWPMYVGRLVSGMAFGIKFFVDMLNLSLFYPGKDQSAALMMTRITNGGGMACGFLVQPSLTWLANTFFPNSHLAANQEVFGVGAMALLAVVFGASMLAFMPVPEPVSETTESAEGGVAARAPQHDGGSMPLVVEGRQQREKNLNPRKMTMIFCTVVYFTRSFTQSVQDSALVILLTYTYKVPASAGISNFFLRVSVVFSRVLILELQDYFGAALLPRWLEIGQICVLPFMFIISTPQVVTFTLFLVAFTISFNINGTQIALLAAHSAKYVLPSGHPYFSKKALSLYLFLAVVAVHFLGPLVGFSILDGSLDQNRIAALMMVLTPWHAVSTFIITGQAAPEQIC